MAKKIDLKKLKSRSLNEIDTCIIRVQDSVAAGGHYTLIRWMSAMTAVQLHSVWERYAEWRLVAALNHNAKHFIAEEGIVGVSHVSSGLASFIVRGGNRYFDFRSMSDLIAKSDRWLGRAENPFRNLDKVDSSYIDALASVRNAVVHGSDAAKRTYCYHLNKVYGIKFAPTPEEFLNAKDNRAGSPSRYQPRLTGFSVVVKKAIQLC
ncbi:hypothetical protein KQX63_21885 [Rhodopseudomonas palustris]|uniref:hypothetical protein n=1 Tax=Rhodopseudomonas palustris TaxID=1076 RepID=UPI0021F367F3|nr:hypothetical protein [Rhodopseudomonas palustris]UYO43993.1 hypothetical protein KQX63_21885 [Rhodopseudomonas palustris]